MTNKELCIKLANYFNSQVSPTETMDDNDEIIFATLLMVSREIMDISNSLEDFKNDKFY